MFNCGLKEHRREEESGFAQQGDVSLSGGANGEPGARRGPLKASLEWWCRGPRDHVTTVLGDCSGGGDVVLQPGESTGSPAEGR